MPQKEAVLVNYIVEWREEFGVNSNIHVWTLLIITLLQWFLRHTKKHNHTLSMPSLKDNFMTTRQKYQYTNFLLHEVEMNFSFPCWPCQYFEYWNHCPDELTMISLVPVERVSFQHLNFPCQVSRVLPGSQMDYMILIVGCHPQTCHFPSS